MPSRRIHGRWSSCSTSSVGGVTRSSASSTSRNESRGKADSVCTGERHQARFVGAVGHCDRHGVRHADMPGRRVRFGSVATRNNTLHARDGDGIARAPRAWCPARTRITPSSDTLRVACKTRGAPLRRAINAAIEWCRRHRHDLIKAQHLALTRKLNGHYNYYGVNGNLGALQRLRYVVLRAWRKWSNRRSQRARMNWKRFNELLKAHPLPVPTIKVQSALPCSAARRELDVGGDRDTGSAGS